MVKISKMQCYPFKIKLKCYFNEIHLFPFKVAYYSFIRVHEMYTINVQFNLFFSINILITNKNPYMRQLLL